MKDDGSPSTRRTVRSLPSDTIERAAYRCHQISAARNAWLISSTNTRVLAEDLTNSLIHRNVGNSASAAIARGWRIHIAVPARSGQGYSGCRATLPNRSDSRGSVAAEVDPIGETAEVAG
jgi:hypothetical protein